MAPIQTRRCVVATQGHSLTELFLISKRSDTLASVCSIHVTKCLCQLTGVCDTLLCACDILTVACDILPGACDILAGACTI